MRRFLLTLTTTCLLLVPMARATVLVPAEFREVVRGSELIAYGRVVDVRAQWQEGRQRIDSVVTMEVASWLKGGTDRTLNFAVPGGELGRYREVIVGAPLFKPGDEAVLFLRYDGKSLPYVYGLNQGVFRVRVDAQSGRRMVAAPLIARDAPERLRRGSATRAAMELDAFGAQVRAVMAEAAGGGVR
jgi:hypothetical protein